VRKRPGLPVPVHTSTTRLKYPTCCTFCANGPVPEVTIGVVLCRWHVTCCTLRVVCCTLRIVCCVLSVACWTLHVGRCMCPRLTRKCARQSAQGWHA
jgi:hypothetical protein